MRLVIIGLALVVLAGCGIFQDDDSETFESTPTEEQAFDEDNDTDEAIIGSEASEESEEASLDENESVSSEIGTTSPDNSEPTPDASDTASSEPDTEQQDSLCNPPLQLLPCPRTFTDDELRATVDDAIEWLFGDVDSDSLNQEGHPFLSEPQPEYDALYRDPWVFDADSQVFACIGVRPNSPAMFPERLQGQLVCYHTILPPGAGQFIVFFPCDRLELGGYLCWRETDAAPETSNHAMVCNALPFLKEYLEPGDFVGFFAECAPVG